jgi:hypothetical protein
MSDSKTASAKPAPKADPSPEVVADPPPFTIGAAPLVPSPGKSYSPGLKNIEGSTVPGHADGTLINHVHGPGQAPADPIAAGLDTSLIGKEPAPERTVINTGTLASGNLPATYAQHGGEVNPPNSAPVVTAPAAPAPATAATSSATTTAVPATPAS